MTLKTLLTSLLFLFFINNSVFADVSDYNIEGRYELITKSDFDSATELERRQKWFYVGNERNGKSVFYCADTSSRKVPGKLVEGYCYIPWGNTIYKHSTYLALRRGGSSHVFTDLSYLNFNSWLDIEIKKFVFPGGSEQNSGHCRVLHNEGFYDVGRLDVRYNKYIFPSFGEWEKYEVTCHVAWDKIYIKNGSYGDPVEYLSASSTFFPF